MIIEKHALFMIRGMEQRKKRIIDHIFCDDTWIADSAVLSELKKQLLASGHQLLGSILSFRKKLSLSRDQAQTHCRKHSPSALAVLSGRGEDHVSD